MSENFLTKTRKLATVFIVAFSLIMTLANIVNAQDPGDLDLTFNNTGVVTFTTGLFVDGSYDVALQEDGKIVTTGCSSRAENTCDVTVVRFNGDGSLDTDFNGTGVVTTPVTNGFNGGASIAIQPNDGKIVITGEGSDITPSIHRSEIVLVRYETDGSLDLSLKGTGFLTTSVSNWDYGQAVAIQPDGKIVVAGERNEPDPDITIVRYNDNGDLDNSFSNDGIVVTQVGNSSTARSVALQADDKIVVAGYYEDGDNYFVVARYTVTGTLDTEFNGSGLVTGTIQGEAHAAAIQPDGKIIVVGSDDDFVIARYLTNGDLDSSFGANGTGVVTTSIGLEGDRANAVALQDDGKIVVAGIGKQTISSSDFAIVRYTSGGNLDKSFNRTGIVTTSIAGSNESGATGVAIQSDGNIVAAGTMLTNRPAPVYVSLDFVVVRYIGDFSTYVPVIFKDCSKDFN